MSFSIAVTGQETIATGYVIRAGMNRYPGSTWYARTNTANRARAAEVKLGRTKYASAGFRSSADRAAADLASPPQADVTIHFEKISLYRVRVVISGGGRSREITLTITDDGQGGSTVIEAFALRVARMIGDFRG